MRRTVAATVVALIGACGPSDSSTSAFTVRDSVGISIVESIEPLWAPGEEWRLADEPDVAIGVAEGDERYLLSRIQSVTTLSDGRIAVLDGGSSRVRVYDPEGRHLVDMGGPGDGPSELNRAHHLATVADTLIVFEDFPLTYTWFTADGEFVRTRRAPRAPAGHELFASIVGVVDGTSVVAVAHPPGRPERVLGRNADPVSLWRLDLNGEAADSLARMLSDESEVYDEGGGVRSRRVIFGPDIWISASHDRVFYGRSDRYEISVMDGGGRLEALLRRSSEPRAVVDIDVDRYVEQMGTAEGLAPDQIDQAKLNFRQDMPRAETMPFFRWMVADEVGNLWVEDFDDVGVDRGAFSVFGSDGVWLGRVELPAGLPWLRGINRRLLTLEIGADYVLGVWMDELGVEQVRRYRLFKGA